MFVLPWHRHIPDPKFVNKLENKRIFLDVGTILRAIIFPESYSSRLLEHIERTVTARAIICKHVQNKCINILTGYNRNAVADFTASLLGFIKNNTLEIVEDGNPYSLPIDAQHDPRDDDIILATALEASCEYLATLDRKLSQIAQEYIEIIEPSHREMNETMTLRTSINDVRMYNGPYEGSIIMHMHPATGSVNYKNGKELRVMFCTNSGLGFWLNESDWRYEVGNLETGERLFKFPYVSPEGDAWVGISYEISTNRLICGLTNMDDIHVHTCTLDKVRYSHGIGNAYSLTGYNNEHAWNGYWKGVLSTQKFMSKEAMKYALKEGRHFIPLDCQHYPIEDSLLEKSLIINPEWIFSYIETKNF